MSWLRVHPYEPSSTVIEPDKQQASELPTRGGTHSNKAVYELRSRPTNVQIYRLIYETPWFPWCVEHCVRSGGQGTHVAIAPCTR